MSQQLISRSADLKRLRDEGFDVTVVEGTFLLVRSVPYVVAQREVRHDGILVSRLELADDVTVPPSDHVVYFVGDAPHDHDGQRLDRLINAIGDSTLANGLVVNCTFSSKPTGGYVDYFDKMTTYVKMLSHPAQQLDPQATARTFPVIVDEDDPDTVFQYFDTASSRAGIGAVTRKLELPTVAIVGLGGTGSYILDLVSKTPVRQIHVYDGDRFIQHNAFRSPGAASREELSAVPSKAEYFAKRYSRIHKGVVPHPHFIDDSNVEELASMGFVFLAIDRGSPKRRIIETLEASRVPFTDVGMGIHEVDGALLGLVRTTTSTRAQRDHVAKRIPLDDGQAANDYAHNIQIADLNALNAALAVIKWKKLCGFYTDQEQEHSSVYMIGGNHLVNDDQATQ